MRKLAVVAVAALALVACFAEPEPMPEPTPEPEVEPTELLRAFSGCVQTPDLAAAGFAQKWSQLSSNTGACQVCHTTAAAGGFEPIAPDDETATDQVAGSLVRIEVFFAADGDNVIVHEDHFIATSSGAAPHEEHPRYDVDGLGTLEALQEIYASAHARFNAGACDEPRF